MKPLELELDGYTRRVIRLHVLSMYYYIWLYQGTFLHSIGLFFSVVALYASSWKMSRCKSKQKLQGLGLLVFSRTKHQKVSVSSWSLGPQCLVTSLAVPPSDTHNSPAKAFSMSTWINTSQSLRIPSTHNAQLSFFNSILVFLLSIS